MARRHHRHGRKGKKGMTKGGLSSKGHRAPPFANKGGRYSSVAGDNMHRPDSAPLIRSDDAAMANVAP
jgi:hypothetical protein